MKKVAIIYQSNSGHTAVLAKAVEEGARSMKGIQAVCIDVASYAKRSADLDDADAIIMGAPTFMGNVPASFKQFMDDTAPVWVEQRWKGKLAAGFTCSACWSGDKLNTLMQMAIFAAQHSMMWVPLGVMPGFHTSGGTAQDVNRVGGFLGAMAQANADESAEVAPPQADRKTAFLLGQNVAKAALRMRLDETVAA
jgi:NAD(P)H dehydrogenase (quinone)